MRKISVYLTEEQAERLRHLSLRTGRPQAVLIREGVRRVIDETDLLEPRVFHSMGMGRSGRPYEPWSADELYQKDMGRR
jgi:hypothetical protein